MTLVKCPFCAEDIQEAAVVCKHCGRSVTEQHLKPKVSDDDILAVCRAGKTGGRCFALICLPNRIIARTVMSGCATLIFAWWAIIVAKNRVKALCQYNSLRNLPVANDDIMIELSNSKVTLIPARGIIAPALEVSTGGSMTKYFLQNRADAQKLRSLYGNRLG